MSSSFKVGDWLVDPSRNCITREQDERQIEPRHMRILVYLSSHPGKQIASTTLLQQAYRRKNASEDSLHIAINHLREAFGDTGKRARYIKRVPGKGYILVAKVKSEERKDAPRKIITWKWIAAACVVALVVFLLQRQQGADASKTEEPINSITMQPFQDKSNSEATQRLTMAVDANIRRRLSSLTHLNVVAYPDVEAGDAHQLEAGLGVDAVIEGWVGVGEDKRVTVGASIFRLGPRRRVFSRQLDGPLDRIQHMQQVLSRQISNFLNAPGSATGGDGDTLPEAYEAFIEGHALLGKQDYEGAIIHFENARTLSPDFADPYLGLALAKTKIWQGNPLLLQRQLPELIELLERAISLKPDLAEAYTSLGTLHFFYTWNFEKADQNFTKALELNPNNPEAHHRFAMFCVAFGRFDKGLEHLEVVRKLAPYSYSHIDVAFMYNIMGDFAASERELRALAEKDPTSPEHVRGLLRLMESQNREEDAFRCYEWLFKQQGYSEEELTSTRDIFKNSGLMGLSRWLAFDKFEERDVGQYEAPLSVARYLATTNDKNLAFDWLEKALAMKQLPLLWVNVDPKYDPLRGDPRFGQLIRKIGLDYSGAEE